MTEARTYTGGCHCGRVRYEVALALEGVATCNCSICAKTGWAMAFAPEEKFTLTSGRDALGDYQFHKHQVHHVFCRACGIRSFAYGAGRDGKTTYSINVRCLDGVDVDALPVTKYDGRSL